MNEGKWIVICKLNYLMEDRIVNGSENNREPGSWPKHLSLSWSSSSGVGQTFSSKRLQDGPVHFCFLRICFLYRWHPHILSPSITVT